MPNPSELLTLAQKLSNHPNSGTPNPIAPNDAELRRAVSTAYYALFHSVLTAAANRFVGTSHHATGGFSLIYRGFDHVHMKRTCEDLQVSTLKPKLQESLRRLSVSQETRDFAGAFPDLQEARHKADYDPNAQFLQSDVVSLVDAAEVAIQAFDRIASVEQTDILALLLVKAR